MENRVGKTFALQSIRTKLFLLVGVILVASFTVFGYQQTRLVTKIIQGEALVKAQSDLFTGLEIINLKYPGPWRVEGDKLYKGDTLMNNNFEIVDLIGRLTHGNTATIFLGDTRIATNVMVDGRRAVGTKVSEIVKKTVLEGGEIYLGQANVVGHTYQTAYMPLKDADGNIVGMWYVGAPDASDRIQQLKRDILLDTVWQALVILAIALLLNYIFSLPMLKRIETAAAALRLIAGGDLSGQPLRVKNNDETGQLMKSVNRLKEDFQGIIAQIQSSSGQLAASSEQMIANADQTSAVSEQIAAAIQEVASGSERQLAEIARAEQAVAEISAGMNQAAQLIQSISDFSLEANERAKSGSEKVASAIAQMDQVQRTVDEAAEVIRKLGDSSQEIGQIVKVITAIATQTNLLALNAQIEAARAGEHGRGFAVVADEVRKLADQSARSAGEIGEWIQRVQAEAQQAVRAMNDGMEVVREGMGRVQETGYAFEEITGAIDEMASRFREVLDIVKRMHAETRNIVDLMRQVSDISRQTSANAQNVAASAEQQAASWEEIAASARSLGEMAEQLQELIRKFKV